MEQKLIKIDKEFVSFLRISYYCPGCHMQVILTPDIGEKEYFSCGKCRHSIHVRSTEFHHINEIKKWLAQTEYSRSILERTGFQVWIEGQPDPTTFYRGSTSLKRTYSHPFWEKDKGKYER